MAVVDLVMPKMGESIMEATILKWFKQPGDTIKMDETLLEIATDKVDSEVPSTTGGVVEEILYKVNDVVPVGKVIARIRTNVEERVTATPRQPETRTAESKQITPKEEKFEYAEAITSSTQYSNSNSQSSNGSGNRFYSPLVLNIAASEGVSMTELEKIPGTGNEGRVTKKDILQFVSQRKTGRSRDAGVRSQESGVGSQESGVGSRESGVGSRESGIGSQS